MKKLIIAVATAATTAAATADVSPFVAVEREVNNTTNRAIVGIDANVGPIGVEAKYSLTAPNTTKFESEKVDIDLTYGVTDSVGVYMKNELTKEFKHNATVVGVKWSF